MYGFTFYFPDDIKIQVEYNTVRREWDIEIWSGKSGSFLYYYDCLSFRPWQTINYMVKRFDLATQVEAAVKIKRERERKEREVAHQIKSR